MGHKDIITMNIKEIERLKVITDVIEKKISRRKAAARLNLSSRQIRRLIKRFKAEGPSGLTNKHRNSVSNRKLPDEVKSKVLSLYKEKYHDFGPTFFCEKLFELHRITLSKETARKWLIEEGLLQRERKTKVRKQLRERKHCFGEMLQLDGSRHDWFEKRRDKAVIMSFIDDATGMIFSRFYEYEGTIPAMDLLKHYIEKYGHIPSLKRHAF